MKILFTFWQWFWGTIQTIIGGLGWLVTRPFQKTTFNYRGACVTVVGKSWGGISFGKFIFLCEYMNADHYIHHEYGHCLQSLLLGPFYLLVIGLPSICWAGFGKSYRAKTGKSYYDFYTEAWANKWGGVKE